jgi:hypothetical protein
MRVKIKTKGETVAVNEKFKKREFVATVEGSYPQDIQFQLSQDKCSLLDNFQVGEEIEIEYNLRGREWTSPQGETKYFNTLEVWKIGRVEDLMDELP